MYLKMLSVLHNLNKTQCVFVDNSPLHLYENLEYGVPIVPFFGENSDRELLKLLLFLKGIKSIKEYKIVLKK